MAQILSILVFLGVLFLHIPYTQERVDYEINAHRHEIETIQNDPHQMSKVTIHKVKNDDLGRIVIVENEDIE